MFSLFELGNYNYLLQLNIFSKLNDINKIFINSGHNG